MKKWVIIALCACLAVSITACEQRGNTKEPVTPQNQSLHDDDSISANSAIPQLSESENSNVESSSQGENSSAESGKSASENAVAVSMINVNKSIKAFDMKENDTEYGWTLTEIEPYDTPPEAAFYGFLTFTGEVALTGTITHVNMIYDGFEFIPDEESKGNILIPDGNPEKDFFVSIVNDDDPSIVESISDLAVNESGEYTIVITQYHLAYVPMMATNNAVVSSIKKK